MKGGKMVRDITLTNFSYSSCYSWQKHFLFILTASYQYRHADTAIVLVY